MQLHICDNICYTRNLPQPHCSFLRVDALHEVPLEILEPYLGFDEVHLQLKEKSYGGLLHFLKQRKIIEQVDRGGASQRARSNANPFDLLQFPEYVKPVGEVDHVGPPGTVGPVEAVGYLGMDTSTVEAEEPAVESGQPSVGACEVIGSEDMGEDAWLMYIHR